MSRFCPRSELVGVEALLQHLASGIRTITVIAVALAAFAGCGGSSSAPRYDEAKISDCVRTLDVDYLEPPKKGVFELSYSENQYGYGTFILVLAAAKDESAAKHDVGVVRQRIESRLGPGRVEWEGKDSNVAYMALGPVMLRELPAGVARADVQHALEPVAKQMRSDIKRCLDRSRTA